MIRYIMVDCEKTEVNCTSVGNRSGFKHIVVANTPYGVIKHSVQYYNRTWEANPYDTAIRGLCDKIVMTKYSLSSRSYYNTKKHAYARNEASNMFI